MAGVIDRVCVLCLATAMVGEFGLGIACPESVVLMRERGNRDSKCRERDAIRRVDFAGMSYPTVSPGSEEAPRFAAVEAFGPQVVALQGGAYRQPTRRPGQFDEHNPYVFLGQTLFGDLTGDGRDDAVVVLRVKSGGTLGWGYIYVFTLEGCTPRLLQGFTTGDRAAEGLRAVSVQGGRLIIDVNDPRGAQGDCCTTTFTRHRLRWAEGRFQEDGKPALMRDIGQPSRK